MSDKQKHELLLDLYRTEIIEGARLRDNLYDENNRLLIENDELEAEITKLTEELSYAHHKIERLEEKANTFEYENGRYIKVEDVPQALKKSPAATDDGKDN